MDFGRYKDIEYRVFDPTGNITALVETAVDVADQPAVASLVMDAEPDVEQVGFVRFLDEAEGAAQAGRADVRLRMAGGEFCGNATMCAAALYLLKGGADKAGSAPAGSPESAAARTVTVKVSGTAAPLCVALEPLDATILTADPYATALTTDLDATILTANPDATILTATPDATGFAAAAYSNGFAAAVEMPPALGIDALRLADGMLPGSDSLDLPVVRMEGIAHVIIEPDSGFYGLKDDPAMAETLLRGWCGALGADCLGMMFLEEGSAPLKLTPLVYVPGADTMFWENSCASGSAAAGIYLAAKNGKAVDVTFDEPAGRLRVESDPAAKKTILHGTARLVK